MLMVLTGQVAVRVWPTVAMVGRAAQGFPVRLAQGLETVGLAAPVAMQLMGLPAMVVPVV